MHVVGEREETRVMCLSVFAERLVSASNVIAILGIILGTSASCFLAARMLICQENEVVINLAKSRARRRLPDIMREDR
jgi:preprotein translocase subunit SecF